MSQADHEHSRADVTLWLNQASEGDSSAANHLFEAVYDELRRVADRYLSRERPDHTLQATALVHEAYVNLVRTGDDDPSWTSRGHFFAVAARAMRHILVNHAKMKKRAKRGGGRSQVPIDERIAAPSTSDVDLLALDETLERLAEHDARKAQIVEMRYFAGMTEEEVAGALSVSERTVRREWNFAKAWLRSEMMRDQEATENHDGPSEEADS